MATNDQNVRLRVSAQTQGLNELQRVSEQLEKLEKSQADFARSAGTAGRSLADLERDLKTLDGTAKRLNGVQQLGDNLDAQRRSSRGLRTELGQARRTLADYEKSLEGVGKRTRAQEAELKRYRGEVTRLETAERKTFETRRRLAAQLRENGVTGGRGGRAQVNALVEANQRLLVQNRQEIAGFDRRVEAQRKITAEAERRIAVEQAGARRIEQQERDAQRAREQRRARLEQATSVFRPQIDQQDNRARLDAEKRVTAELTKQRNIIEQRRAAERQVSSGFGDFSRSAAGAPSRAREADRQAAAAQASAQAAIAARRKAQLDADLADRAAQSRAAALEQRIQKQLGDRPALLGRVTNATRQASAATRQAAASQTGLVAALRATAGQGRTTLDFFQRLRGQVLELAATYGSLITAVTVAQQAIAVSIERTGIENRLLFANNNDIRKTAEDLAFVRETADRLGQSYNNLAKLYSRFAAASAAAGEPVEKTRRIFGQLAEAFTVLGLSQADIEGSFRALEQSISKGTVQAEELRGQLGDRFPGAVQRFAKAIGVSVAELTKLLEAGRVSSAAIEFFAEDISIAARSTLPRATNSLQASLSRLRTAYEDFLNAIVENGFGDQLADLSRQLVAFFKSADGAAFAQNISGAFSVVVTVAKLLVENIDSVFFVFRLLIGYIAGRVFAAAIAGAITGFSALGRVLGALIPALFGTGVAAGRAAIGVRTLTAALGPVALVVGLVATALFEFGIRAADAERRAEELADEMRNLAKARGEELIAARDSNAAQLEEIKNTRELIKLKIEEAEKRLAAAKAANEEAQRSSQAAAQSGAPVRFGNLSASAEVSNVAGELRDLRDQDREKADEQQTREAAQIAANARVREQGEEAREEALRRIADLEADLADEDFRNRVEKNDLVYDKLAERVKEISEITQVARGAGALSQSADDRISGALSQARSVRLAARDVVLPGSSSDDKKAERDAKDREREITQLQEAAQAERERSLRDSLERLAEDEATAAEARVELIKLEYANKIAEQTKYQQEAKALGGTALAAQFTANIGALEGEREQVIAAEQRRTAVEGVRTEYEKLNTALEASVRQRDLELERINTERELGLITSQQAEQQAEAITRKYQPQILANLQALRDFIEANAGALSKLLNVDEVLLQLDNLRVQTETVVTAGQRRAQELKESFAQGASQALSSLGTGIADAIRGFSSFGDAIKGARDAFLNFAADFLIEIGRMILQQAILNALQNSENSFFQMAGNAIAGGFHNGGVIGRSAPTFTRSVSPSIFANAPRYHSGGIAGLKPDEVPAILQTGEEVLSRNNPRNALNSGTAGGSVQIVNAIDSESVVAAGLQGAAGKRIITNVIQANRAAFRQILAS